MGATDHVRVRHDVSVRINNNPRSDDFLFSEYKTGACAATIFYRTVTAHQHLDHTRRNSFYETPDRAVQLMERIRIARISTRSVGSLSGDTRDKYQASKPQPHQTAATFPIFGFHFY